MSDQPGVGARQSANGDWPAEAADTIVRVVGQVRDKTTGPAITVARAIVYGLLAGITGAMALVLLAIMAVRVIDVYLPESVTGDDNTWLAHTLVGLLLVAAGLVLWSRRSPRAEEA